MDSYKETFETWNKIASLYQDKFMHLDLYDDTYDIFCNSIKKGHAKILDVGCGPGNISKYLLKKRSDFQIQGIDIAPKMIELAKKNIPTASFRVFDSRQINKLNTKFDGIICGFCLPYLSGSDTVKLISDSFNLLTDNGSLYLSFVEGNPVNSGYQIGSSGDRIYFYYHYLKNLNEQLAEIGFEKPRMYKINYKKTKETTEVHTALITTKKIPYKQGLH